MNTPTLPAPLFLYLKGTEISEKMMANIEAAGYIAIEVDDFEAVKIVQPITALSSDPIAQAALKAVKGCGYDSALTIFAKGVLNSYISPG
jgi:hypothetical protein